LIVNRGTRLAIVAGIIVAVAGVAVYAAVASPPDENLPPADNNNTNSEPRQITIQLNETMSVDAK
jgi:hypothetical protein